MKKTLITGFLFANVIFCSSAIAGTGACESYGQNPLPTSDKCWCDSGQPLGSCFTRLGGRAVAFPTLWKVTRPGALYGWELNLNPSNDSMFLAYMGEVQGVYPVTMQSAAIWRHRSDSQGSYYVSGEANFYLDQIPITLKHVAIQSKDKSGEYTWLKEICFGGLCYASD